MMDQFLGWLTSIGGSAFGANAGETCFELNCFANAGGAMLGNLTGSVYGTVLSLLPDGGIFPPEMHTAAVYFGNTLRYVDFILPTGILIECVMIVLAVKMTLWGLHIAIVGINFLRGIPTATYRWKTY